MFPYKDSRVDKVRQQNLAQWVAFRQWYEDKMSSDYDILSQIKFSDECVFHVSCFPSTWYTRMWGAEHLREIESHEESGEK